MHISFPMGDFSASLLDSKDHVTLIAAGSGELVISITASIYRYASLTKTFK